MLRLDVIAIGLVAFELPARIHLPDAEDLDRALRLLSEGGCRAAIVDFHAVIYVSGEGLRRLAEAAARTHASDMRLAFVVDGNPVALRLLHGLIHRGGLYRTLEEATSALTPVKV